MTKYFLESLFALFALFAFFGDQVVAQNTTCENDGVLNSDGSSCDCQLGFGGSTCSLPACGGDIFQGTNRSIVGQPSAPGTPANLTANSCSCEDGWSGFGCNVCQSASACQTGFSRVNGGSSSQTSLPGIDPDEIQNGTLVCNTSPRVWAVGELSCSVINPTLQSLFPLSTELNILRTINPSQTPIPNVTGFGAANTAFAQVWYDGVEQFYCSADQCQQTESTSDGSSSDYTCQNLSCTCRSNTTFCGGSAKLNLASTLNGLSGQLTVSCSQNSTGSSCSFKQSVLQSLFGSNGLGLSDCQFGECVAQSVIDSLSSNSTSSASGGGKSLSGGVIAGLAVVGGLLAIALAFLILGLIRQRRARRFSPDGGVGGGVGVVWKNVSYAVPGASASAFGFLKGREKREGGGFTDDKVVLDNVSGHVAPGEMMAILGPSGAGKTTLVEILARKSKTGYVSGNLAFPIVSATGGRANPRIAFVPQQDVLPPTLTVREALSFAAALRLPEHVSKTEKASRVEYVLEQLGLVEVANSRIGDKGKRGLSGGEMRRLTIGLELIGDPDVLILDEPTSGLDSVSAARVAAVLKNVARGTNENSVGGKGKPVAVVCSIHQPSSKLYHTFDRVLLLSHGRALYSGRGGLAPAEHIANVNDSSVPLPPEGYNIADHLLDIASDPPTGLFQHAYAEPTNAILCTTRSSNTEDEDLRPTGARGSQDAELEKGTGEPGMPDLTSANAGGEVLGKQKWWHGRIGGGGAGYAATFLTQFEELSGREWKVLRRDKTLFITHVGAACILGVFCGGLYFHTNETIAGFQSRVGCLFFLGSLITFSSLSALYNVVETRPLFLRERSNSYYSPTAWLLSRVIFDVIPLRIIPTIIVATITYWMAGLAHDAAHFFKFLFILVLFSLAMTLFNFLLGCLFTNGGVAILLSALAGLYQMTFAGFFVHLDDIPPVLRWLQWFCPLKYCLEALSVNEVDSGLMITDTLQGVPVNVSASFIMQLLFGFGLNNYYRDVLVLFAFIAGFGLGVIAIVWLKVRERR